MTIKKYNILESELSSKAYEAGNLYFCTDSANIYYDSTLEEKRIHINNSMIALETEADRENLLNPILYKIYFIKETNRSYIYIGAEWVRVGISSWNDLEDKPFDTIRTETVVLDEMTFYGGGSGIQISIEEEFENVEHTVIFDGVEYKCTPNITDGDSVLGDSGYWYCLTYDYPFGISYIHKQLYTSDGSTHTIKVVKNVSETVKQIEDKYISENIARIDDLMQSDYDQNDSSSLDHIKNRPFYKETREITWDGDTTGKTAVSSGYDNMNYYKIAEIDHTMTYESMRKLSTIQELYHEDGTIEIEEGGMTAHFPNIFVISIKNNGLFYSIDGKQWNPTNITSKNFPSIVYNNGIFLAYSNSDDYGIYISYNGIDWSQTNKTSGKFSIINYLNGIWIAGASSSNGIWYSTDAVDWSRSNITSGNFSNVCYANGIWIAGSYDSNGGIYYSTDGMTWTRSNITSRITNVWYLNNMWISSNYSTNTAVYYSTDGMTWTLCNCPETFGAYDIKYLNNIYIGSVNKANDSGLYYSIDGITWNRSNMVTGGFFDNTTSCNDVLIAFDSYDSNGIYYSTDGMTWTQSNITSESFNCSCNTNGICIISSNFNKGILYSTNGMTWNQSNIISGSVNNIHYSNGIWVATGYNNTAINSIYYSTDGMTWIPSNLYKSTIINGIVSRERNAWISTGYAVITKNNTYIEGILFEEPGLYLLKLEGYLYTSKLEWEYTSNLNKDYLNNNIFIAYYGVTTYKEIEEAKNNGKICICIFNNVAYNVVATLIEYNSTYMRFNYLDGNSRNHGIIIYSSDNRWTSSTTSLQQTSNLTTLIDSGCTDTQYPSAKAVHTHVVEAMDSLYVDLDTVINSESTHDTGPSAKAVYDYVNNIFGLSD